MSANLLGDQTGDVGTTAIVSEFGGSWTDWGRAIFRLTSWARTRRRRVGYFLGKAPEGQLLEHIWEGDLRGVAQEHPEDSSEGRPERGRWRIQSGQDCRRHTGESSVHLPTSDAKSVHLCDVGQCWEMVTVFQPVLTTFWGDMGGHRAPGAWRQAALATWQFSLANSNGREAHQPHDLDISQTY